MIKNPYPLNLLIIFVFTLVINLAVHTPFLITDYFGEQDAARIAFYSIKASYGGGFHGTEYGIYSSPLYYDILRFFLRTGLISISDIPFWMAFASLISSAVITVTMFIFVFRLTVSVSAAFGASLILQLIPVFWFNNLYGFPTIVALAFFMVSLLLFQSALGNHSSRYKYLLLFGTLIMYILAVMTKIDVLLASAIYCLPVWKSDRSFKSKVSLIGCLALFSGSTFLLFDQYAEILSASTGTVFSLSRFNSAYPYSFDTFFSREHFILIARTVGILSIPTALIGLVFIGWRKEWKSIIFWLALSGLPPVLFWGMREGNSARHDLIPSIFLCILLALPLTMRTWRKWAWSGLLFVMCLINYLYFPPSNNPNFPSGQLLASTYLIKEDLKYRHLIGKAIAHLPYEKVAVIGEGWMYPYFGFEVLRNNHRSYVKYTHSKYTQTKRAENLKMQNKNQEKLFRYIGHKPDISEINALISSGYFLAICDKGLAKELGQIAELQDKWISIDQLKVR